MAGRVHVTTRREDAIAKDAERRQTLQQRLTDVRGRLDGLVSTIGDAQTAQRLQQAQAWLVELERQVLSDDRSRAGDEPARWLDRLEWQLRAVEDLVGAIEPRASR